MQEQKHHPLGPSRYPAWAECPCWSPDDRETKESSEGSAAHEELHLALTDKDYVPDDSTVAWAAKWVDEHADLPLASEMKIHGTVGKLCGIFGTADIVWRDRNGTMNFADFKRFSDGTTDYMPQVRGYAALWLPPGVAPVGPVGLHILHGGSRTVESVATTFSVCIEETVKLLESVGKGAPRICKWCQWCSKASTCAATNHAVTTVRNNLQQFSKLSLCQKLVVLDAIDKLSKSIRETAKAQANANGGVLEQDGIRYELKPWGGSSVCRDIREVADAMYDPVITHKLRNSVTEEVKVKGLSNAELLAACTLSKSALVARMRKKNAESKVTKADIERWADSFFEKTDGTPHFVRVK